MLYLVEYGHGENFQAVQEWFSDDGYPFSFSAPDAYTAAHWYYQSEGFYDFSALLRVWPVRLNEFGRYEKCGDCSYFSSADFPSYSTYVPVSDDYYEQWPDEEE